MFIFMWSGIVISQISMALLLYAIWGDIADSCGYEKDSTFRYYGFGGILLSLMMGGAMIPYKSWMLGLANTWKEVTGGNINLGFMFLVTGICGTIIITAYVFLGAKLFNVDFSTMEAFDVEKLGEESKHLRPRAKRIIVVYLITMLLAIFAGTFLTNPLSKFLNGTLTLGGLYCLCSAILMVIPSGEGDGKPAIVFNDIKHSDAAVSWPVIMMCAVTIPMATALTNEATGVLPWLTGIFAPIFEGKSPIFILVFTIVVMLILTNVGSNIAFGGAMIPVISPFVIASGMNPVLAGAALIWVANMGLILPGSSAPSSIFHGRSEIPDVKLRNKAVIFAALLIMVVTIVVFPDFQFFMGLISPLPERGPGRPCRHRYFPSRLSKNVLSDSRKCYLPTVPALYYNKKRENPDECSSRRRLGQQPPATSRHKEMHHDQKYHCHRRRFHRSRRRRRHVHARLSGHFPRRPAFQQRAGRGERTGFHSAAGQNPGRGHPR